MSVTATNCSLTARGRCKLLISRLLLCLIVIFSSVVQPVLSSESPSYFINPAGTFFKQDQGYLFTEDVHLFEGIGQSVQSGVTGALYNIATTSAVVWMVGFIPLAQPGPLIAATILKAWRYWTPLTWLRTYMDLVQGRWNASNYRVGRVPVYSSSAVFNDRWLMNWRYPLEGHSFLQLEGVVLPEKSLTEPPQSPVEYQLEALHSAMVKMNLVRFRFVLSEHRFIFSVQNQGGVWMHRFLPRPEQPFIAEQVQPWSGRQVQTAANSLFAPGTLDHLVKSLHCWDQEGRGAASVGEPVVIEAAASQWQLSRSGDRCDYLQVFDNSSRAAGYGGFMHLNLNAACGSDSRLADTRTDYEAELQHGSGHSFVPAWQGHLFLRTLTEGVAYGTSFGSKSLWSHWKNSDPGTARSKASPPVGIASYLGSLVEANGLRCMSVMLPKATAQTRSRPLFCPWYKGQPQL